MRSLNANKNKKKAKSIVMSVIMWVLVLFVYIIPMYFVIINSLKNKVESTVLSIALPTEWRFDNFAVAFTEGKMLQGLGNSLFIAVFVVIVTVLFSALAAFYIQRSNTKLGNFTFYFFALGIALPISVITTFTLLKTMHLINTLIGASFIYIAMRMPLIVFIYVGFLKTIPKELDEAAIIDGCGNFRLFFQIISPLLKPITVTSIVLVAQFVWNSFDVILYFIQSSKKFTLPLSVYTFAGRYTTQWNLIFAGAIISVIPVLIVYLLGQKHIVAGLTSGALKA